MSELFKKKCWGLLFAVCCSDDLLFVFDIWLIYTLLLTKTVFWQERTQKQQLCRRTVCIVCSPLMVNMQILSLSLCIRLWLCPFQTKWTSSVWLKVPRRFHRTVVVPEDHPEMIWYTNHGSRFYYKGQGAVDITACISLFKTKWKYNNKVYCSKQHVWYRCATRSIRRMFYT